MQGKNSSKCAGPKAMNAPSVGITILPRVTSQSLPVCSESASKFFEQWNLVRKLEDASLWVFLITQSKVRISALNLRRLLSISFDLAIRMKHKLQHDMNKAYDSLVLGGLVELDDASYWGGKRKGGKRGRGAPSKSPVLAAVSRNEKDHPIHMRLSKVSYFTSSEVKRWSLKHLHRDCVVISDCFGPLKAIDDTVAVNGSINASIFYDNPEKKIFHWVITVIGKVFAKT